MARAQQPYSRENDFDFMAAPPTLPAGIPHNMLTEDEIRNALKAVKYPGYSRDIVSFGLVKEIAVQGAAVNVRVNLTSAAPEVARQLKTESERVLKDLPGVKEAN